MPPLRLLPSTCRSGAWQMATDAWLLEQAAPSFRLYSWQRPTLSLGFHQGKVEAHWSELASAGVIDLVRRPSGGRAVLHAGEITYGRLATIFCDQKPAIDLLEVSAPLPV